jgi:hypothetical protein
MWEAMGGPLLPKFALAFAEQLKARIEGSLGVAEAAPAKVGLLARIIAWLRGLFR